MEESFIQAKLRTSPGVQSPPRKKTFWRNIVFNTPLYFVETKNIHTSNMTGIFLQGFNRDVGFLGGSDGKESACNGGDCLIPGWGRSSEGGNGYPLQYSCLENSMNRGDWQATVRGDAKSRTQLSN